MLVSLKICKDGSVNVSEQIAALTMLQKDIDGCHVSQK